MLTIFTLKNGLKVAGYSIPQMRSAFLGLAVKGGTIFDKKETSGAAHFMEHMLVQGIPSLPNVEDFSDYIEGLAGGYTAATYGQSIIFTVTAPFAHLEDLIKISSEVFFEPLFPEDAMERERGAILSEIKERQDALWYKNSRFFAKVRYKPNHPLLRDGGGSVETVNKLAKQDLINYWKKFFYPSNTCLVVVGSFKGWQLKKMAEDYLGKVVDNRKFPGFPDVTNKDLSGRTVAIRFDPNLKICYLDLTFPSIWGATSMQDKITRSIITSIFGGLRRSRLFRLLRQRRGLVYDVSFGSIAYQCFGFAHISSQVATGKLDEVLELIAKELLVFAQNGPTEEEVQFAKNHHINQALMRWDHPSAIWEWIVGDIMWEDKIYTPEEYVKIVKDVSVQNIQEFMKRYWDFAKLNLVVQGPIKDSKANIKKYEGILEVLK